MLPSSNNLKPTSNETTSSSKPQKKLWFVITKTEIGGATRHVRDLILHFQKDFAITVISETRKPDSWLYEQLDQTNVQLKECRWLRPEIRPFSDIILTLWLAVLCWRGRPDILHLHSSKVGILGRLAGFLGRVPKIIFTVHGVSFQAKFGKLKANIFLLAERLTYPLADTIICVSEHDRKIFCNAVGDPRNVVTVICNEIPPPAIIRSFGNRDHRVIGFLGRLAFQKNPQFLIEGFKKLLQRLPPEDRFSTTLKIKGDGPLLPEVKAQIESYQLKSNIEILPPDDQIYQFLKTIDVLVMTSRFEGYPYVLLEGRALGCYLISSDVGGCREIITSDKVGLLYREGSLEELINLMTIALNRSEISSQYDTSKSFQKFVGSVAAVYHR